MLHIRGKEITGVYIAGKAIEAIYVGTRLVWQAVRSCFGRGYWINDKGWRNDDGWKNR